MRCLVVLTLLAALALPACATMPATPAPAFYVMRHLNTPAGERDPSLTPEGRRLSIELGLRFQRGGPAAIYISGYRDQDRLVAYQRMMETVLPLIASLNVRPIIYDPADTPGLVARVRSGPLPALIVGHSNTVPDIVEQLGGPRPAPLTHPDFGDLWILAPDGATQRVRVAD